MKRLILFTAITLAITSVSSCKKKKEKEDKDYFIAYVWYDDQYNAFLEKYRIKLSPDGSVSQSTYEYGWSDYYKLHGITHNSNSIVSAGGSTIGGSAFPIGTYTLQTSVQNTPEQNGVIKVYKNPKENSGFEYDTYVGLAMPK